MMLPPAMLLSMLLLACLALRLLSWAGRRRGALPHAMANLGLPDVRSLMPTLCLLLCAVPVVVWLSCRADAPAGSYRQPIDDAHADAPVFPGLDGERSAPGIDQLVAPRRPSFGAPWKPSLVTPWRHAPGSVNRDWRLLDEDFARRLALVFKIMRQVHGYDMALVEGYRSAERQDVLAYAGAHVTRAKAFQSYHQHGRAADCAFLRDGALHISEKDPWTMRGYRLYGLVAESVGLRWGGRWAMQDYGHAELPLAASQGLRMGSGQAWAAPDG
jgi:hypothetical protein